MPLCYLICVIVGHAWADDSDYADADDGEHHLCLRCGDAWHGALSKRGG